MELKRREAYKFLEALLKPVWGGPSGKVFSHDGMLNSVFEISSGRPREMVRILSRLISSKPKGVISPEEFVQFLKGYGLEERLIEKIHYVARKIYGRPVERLFDYMLANLLPVGIGELRAALDGRVVEHMSALRKVLHHVLGIARPYLVFRRAYSFEGLGSDFRVVRYVSRLTFYDGLDLEPKSFLPYRPLRELTADPDMLENYVELVSFAGVDELVALDEAARASALLSDEPYYRLAPKVVRTVSRRFS